jgi:hypothetical protein
MATRQQNSSEIEQERLRQFNELAAESGDQWPHRFRPGTLGCHELLDRTALLSDLLEQHLIGHPACVANREWYLLAEQAAAALRELYQKIGATHLEDEVQSEQNAPERTKDNQNMPGPKVGQTA